MPDRPKPRAVKDLPGAGKVYDFRGTGLLPGVKDDNGHVIRTNLLLWVEHIPVYPNKPGIEDFYGLADVLRARELQLQTATDRDGNVAIYTSPNILCYQAKGANFISGGTEHMHMTTSEDWTRRQLRASAWIWQWVERYGVPIQGGRIKPAPNNQVSVTRKGHVGHARVSAAAGYNDRSDPGPEYDWKYVRHCAEYWKRKGTFVGA
jgi:N-acetylmuramoyl-L-alanine amidase